jgi:hypothetical protein
LTETGTFSRLAALAFLLCGLSAFSVPVAAQTRSAKAPPPVVRTSTTPKAVIELFTSQGCSSCPAADAMLSQLATRDDLIAISLSVDYWDYLGWKDTLAQAKFSDRQKAYSRTLGDGMVYTPQMVINGRAHVNGSDEAKIKRAIDKTSDAFAASLVPVKLSATDGRLIVEVGPDQDGKAKEATVWLAVISKSVEVPITRGENKGKTVTYSNVVRELMPIGIWNGKQMTVQLERDTFMHSQAERCAVLLQHGKGGPIVGAALLAKL